MVFRSLEQRKRSKAITEKSQRKNQRAQKLKEQKQERLNLITNLDQLYLNPDRLIIFSHLLQFYLLCQFYVGSRTTLLYVK